LAVGFVWGGTTRPMYIVEVGYVLRAFDVSVSWTVFCWYRTCIQQLQQTCLLQKSDIVWWICARVLHFTAWRQWLAFYRL